MMFTFLPLPLMYYSKSPVCIAILYQWYGRFHYFNHGSLWRLHHLPISLFIYYCCAFFLDFFRSGDHFFLTASYATAWIIIFLDRCYVPFDRRITIGLSVLVTCNSIGATFGCDTLFISSDLDQEDT